MKEQDRRWSVQKVVQRFPGWNEVTIANLHSLFLLFDNQTNGMLGFDDLLVPYVCNPLKSLRISRDVGIYSYWHLFTVAQIIYTL